MRLLNTVTFELKEFFNDAMPKYAILSHRWGEIENEVSFKQFQKGRVPPGLPGMVKIRKLCQLAVARNMQWVWIDTCCIDKRSSAELSEAINSMYKWYERSAECYVHLPDVRMSDRDIPMMNRFGVNYLFAPEGSPSFKQSFRNSSWFKRGWTLQELIAPNKVIFYDSRWNQIGPLDDILQEVAEVTGINDLYLGGAGLQKASIATRMSWASSRETSREEDLAYCLLGLFDVNMPLLYGEGGRKAFHRLQTEIMKVSDDETLFAWTSDQHASGLLASHPKYFVNSGNIDFPLGGGRPSFSITNKGLDIAVPKEHLKQSSPESGRLTVRLFLRCSRHCPDRDARLGKALYVGLVPYLYEGTQTWTLIRERCDFLGEATSPEKGDYTIFNLDYDLRNTERVYVYPPGSVL